MSTILLNKSDELYLSKCADEHSFAYGIIIGQWAEYEKFIVVHLAKNSEDDLYAPNAVAPKTVADIGIHSIVTQWMSAWKMTPGSFDVMGIFAATTKLVISQEENFKHAKKLLGEIHNHVQKSNALFYSNESKIAPVVPEFKNPDYLFINYSNETKKTVCMSYTHGKIGGTFSAMDCRFVEKPFEWQGISCNLDLNDVLPVKLKNSIFDIENHFQETVDIVSNKLASSEIFIEHANVDDTLTLENYMRNRQKSKSTVKVSSDKKILNASIYEPQQYQVNGNGSAKMSQYQGVSRFSGIITSRIWCNGQNSLADVKRFLRIDIIRSMAARIQIYCDALTDSVVDQDIVLTSEPPRRIYFNIQTDESAPPVQFSEYIFRGEAPTVAVAQAKQVLDLDISLASIESDVEYLADEFCVCECNDEAVGGNIAQKQSKGMSRFIYIVGIAVAIFVLLLSVSLQYYYNNNQKIV